MPFLHQLLSLVMPHSAGNPQQPVSKTTHPEKSRAKAATQDLTLRALSRTIIKEASHKTAANYVTALRSIAAFNNGCDVTLRQLRPPFLTAYEQWLRERGVCPNTSSCYMRSLRALYNKVVEKHHLRNARPFERVYTGCARTEARVISRADINRLRTLPLPQHSPAALSRDLFLFSFYAMGMPFVDLAFLHTSQIQGDTLTYYRHKTHQRVTVHLEPCMKGIISRYADERSPYVFPILSPSYCGTSDAQYDLRLAQYNKQLKRLGAMAGIATSLSSYTPRRSWATIAFMRNIEMDTISRALGHTNSRTTLIYVRQRNDQKQKKANREILKYVIGMSSTKEVHKSTLSVCYSDG